MYTSHFFLSHIKPYTSVWHAGYQIECSLDVTVDPSITDTIGTVKSIFIREVSSFQWLICIERALLGHLLGRRWPWP